MFFLSSLFFSVKTSSKIDLRVNFERKVAGFEEPVAQKKIANPEMIIPATKKINRAELQMVIDEVEKSTARKNHYLQQHNKTYLN